MTDKFQKDLDRHLNDPGWTDHQYERHWWTLGFTSGQYSVAKDTLWLATWVMPEPDNEPTQYRHYLASDLEDATHWIETQSTHYQTIEMRWDDAKVYYPEAGLKWGTFQYGVITPMSVGSVIHVNEYNTEWEV